MERRRFLMNNLICLLKSLDTMTIKPEEISRLTEEYNKLADLYNELISAENIEEDKINYMQYIIPEELAEVTEQANPIELNN